MALFRFLKSSFLQTAFSPTPIGRKLPGVLQTSSSGPSRKHVFASPVQSNLSFPSAASSSSLNVSGVLQYSKENQILHGARLLQNIQQVPKQIPQIVTGSLNDNSIKQGVWFDGQLLSQGKKLSDRYQIFPARESHSQQKVIILKVQKKSLHLENPNTYIEAPCSEESVDGENTAWLSEQVFVTNTWPADTRSKNFQDQDLLKARKTFQSIEQTKSKVDDCIDPSKGKENAYFIKESTTKHTRVYRQEADSPGVSTRNAFSSKTKTLEELSESGVFHNDFESEKNCSSIQLKCRSLKPTAVNSEDSRVPLINIQESIKNTTCSNDSENDDSLSDEDFVIVF